MRKFIQAETNLIEFVFLIFFRRIERAKVIPKRKMRGTSDQRLI